jgi:hypothetical protein
LGKRAIFEIQQWGDGHKRKEKFAIDPQGYIKQFFGSVQKIGTTFVKEKKYQRDIYYAKD